MRNFTVSSQNGSDSADCIRIDPPVAQCATLGYLLEHVSSCANIRVMDNQTLNTSLLFNQSCHHLYISVDTSSEKVAIRCEDNGGLFFHSSQQIQISNLRFVDCSMNVTDLIDPESGNSLQPKLASITFYRAHDIEVAGCIFGENEGSALLLIDVDEFTVTSSAFNGAGRIDSDRSRSSGIVIRRLFSTIGNFNYTISYCNFTENVNLHKNTMCPNDGSFIEPQVNIGFGGAVDIKLITDNSTTNIAIADSSFELNRAIYGGAVCMSFSGIDSTHTLSFSRSTFEHNMGCAHGGAVSIRTDTELEHYNESNVGHVSFDGCTFFSNSAFWGGGVSAYRCRSCGDIIVVASNTTWKLNNGWTNGFAVAIGGNWTDNKPGNQYEIEKMHAKTDLRNCSFINNTNSGYFQNINAVGALALTSGELLISGVTFEANYGTALLMKGLCRGTITGQVTFKDNFGLNGGAIHIVSGSHIFLNATANVQFTDNYAVVRGGAVYSPAVLETYGTAQVPCLFRFHKGVNTHDNISVTFENNIASNSNQTIFIGNPSQCNETILFKEFTYKPNISNQVQTATKNITFTTMPQMHNNTLTVMLGEEFSLNPTVTDFFGQNSTGFGYIALLNNEPYHSDINFTLVGPSSLGINSYTQNISHFITGPNVTHASLALELIFERVINYKTGSREVSVELVSCKTGFYYSAISRKCECVISKSIICHRTKVCIQYGYWYDNVSKITIPCPTRDCGYSNGHCPPSTEECPTSPGYCTITSPDDVCMEGGGQYLCSGCKKNYSLNFGAFLCVPDSTCKPQNTFFIMFGVVTYSLLFIVVLLIALTLQLQVGSGFMYGLVYYFSVLVLFTNTSIKDPILSTFAGVSISLTQLDPHVIVAPLPICFAKGMNNLHHLMLHYITPVFIISVVTAIVCLSRYCRCPRRISLAENSPIHAICLLILFSYTSLSRTSLLILRPVVIGGSVKVQAVPDKGYFDPEHHLPFALVALFVECFITLPTCFLLILAPCLSRKLNFVKLRLKPIVDEFQACYRPECRWFAGFYFLARELMFLASIIPQQDLPQSNLFLHCLSAIILLIHTSFQPYKKRWLNILDTILLMDIGLLSVYASVSECATGMSGLNRIIYNAAPYVLILIPSCYLLAVLAALFFIRPYKWLKATACRLGRSSSVSEYVQSVPTSNTIEVDASQSISSQNMYNWEREPLLADNTSEMLTLATLEINNK